MFRILKKTLLILVFNSFLFSAYSQSEFASGYVVTTRNDTIRGLIKDKRISATRSIQFKSDAAAAPITYDIGQLNAIRTNDEYYINASTIGFKQTVFLKYL